MRYILFGTGDYYNRFHSWFENHEVIAVLDNDARKQGLQIDGHPIIAPENITEYSYDVVVILSFYVSEMRSQLLEIGVEQEKIFHCYDIHELITIDDNDDIDLAITLILRASCCYLMICRLEARRLRFLMRR